MLRLFPELELGLFETKTCAFLLHQLLFCPKREVSLQQDGKGPGNTVLFESLSPALAPLCSLLGVGVGGVCLQECLPLAFSLTVGRR